MIAEESLKSSIFALMISSFGVGMYFMPSAFAQTGLLYGCLQLIVVGFLSALSNYFLFDFAKYQIKNEISSKEVEEKNKLNNEVEMTVMIPIEEKSQNEMVKNTENVILDGLSYDCMAGKIHKGFGFIIKNFILLNGLAAVLFFQKYMSLVSTKLLGFSEDKDWAGYGVYVAFLAAYATVIFCAGQNRKISDLKSLSRSGIRIILMITGLVFTLYFLLPGFVGSHVANPNQSISLHAFSSFIFAFFCQINSVDIFAAMKKKSQMTMITVSSLASFGVCVIYGLMGHIGSMVFGSNMPQQDIISIFSDSESPIYKYIFQHAPNAKGYLYVIPCLAISGLLDSTVFQLFAVTKMATSFDFMKKKVKSDQKRVLISTFVTILLVTCANLFPTIDLSMVFAFIGNFMCNTLAYMFPFSFSAYQVWKSRNSRDIMSYFRLGLCLVISILSFIYAFYGFTDFINRKNEAMLVENGIFNATETVITSSI